MIELWQTVVDSGLFSIAPLSWKAILACAFSGGIMGFERKTQGKPIGMRTNIVICLGTYTYITAAMAVVTESADPTRVIGQVITGIGFLGAGVILTRNGMVIGVTTAASIWMLAAIGVIIATEPPILGVKLSVLCVFILTVVGYIERGLRKAPREVLSHMDARESDSDDGLPDLGVIPVTPPTARKKKARETPEE